MRRRGREPPHPDWPAVWFRKRRTWNGELAAQAGGNRSEVAAGRWDCRAGNGARDRPVHSARTTGMRRRRQRSMAENLPACFSGSIGTRRPGYRSDRCGARMILACRRPFAALVHPASGLSGCLSNQPIPDLLDLCAMKRGCVEFTEPPGRICDGARDPVAPLKPPNPEYGAGLIRFRYEARFAHTRLRPAVTNLFPRILRRGVEPQEQTWTTLHFV